MTQKRKHSRLRGYSPRKSKHRFLRDKEFSEQVAYLVESHVPAKRYLTFKYPDYYKELSEASKQTLEFQGGQMTAQEAAAFEQDNLFNLSIWMRQWDELAKEVNQPIAELADFKEMFIRHLASQWV